MLASLEKTIDNDIIKELDNILQDYTHEYHISHSCFFAYNYRNIQLTSNETNKSYYLTFVPTNNIETISMNEPKRIEGNVIIINKKDKTAYYIPFEKHDDFSFIPELRQSQYENKDYRKRDADYKYYFDDGDTLIAIPSSNPIPRLEEPITISGIKYLGGAFPQEWILEIENNNEPYYLRERSGSIKLYDSFDYDKQNLIFTAFVGGEHPGTHLKKDEIINLISSVDYINISKKDKLTVSQEIMDKYMNYMDKYLNINEEITINDDSINKFFK